MILNNIFHKTKVFDSYYDLSRFNYIHDELSQSKRFVYKGSERIKKTASFYSPKLNVYIDTSDGVNSDLGIKEYAGRILNIVQETKGKQFLFFKSFFSPEHSSNIVKIANDNNGSVLPFAFWSIQENFYKEIYNKEKLVIKKFKNDNPTYDIGFLASLQSYQYPKPSSENSLISWEDAGKFKLGHSEDTGYFEINTRSNMYNTLVSSPFKVFFSDKLEYSDYIKKTFDFKLCFCPPGKGEYTQRMFEHLALRQAILMRKTSYDFFVSWKDYIAEVDFSKDNFIVELEGMIKDYKIWQEKSFVYSQNLTPGKITSYLIDKIEEHE